jgi:hypothetical protein
MRGQCQLLDKNHQYFQLFHCQQTQSLLITLYLRLFYNGAFSIASNNDLDDQNLLLATNRTNIFLNLDLYPKIWSC